MIRIFLREVVHLDDKIDKFKIHKNNKLPFAVFIVPTNKENNKIENYKEVFTDIISDRIKQKYQ